MKRIPSRAAVLAACLMLALQISARALTASWNSALDVPVTTASQNYNASGVPITFTLNFAPSAAVDLTVVKMTSLSFINGTFNSLTQGQAVTMTYAGKNYNFIANYYGGTGNDLVLQWADVRLMGWGRNLYGQVGGNTPGNSSTPEAVNMVGALAGKSVLSEAGGTFHSLVLCSDGTVAAWGKNQLGELGVGNFTNTLTPTQVLTSGALAGKKVIAVAAGEMHSLALCSDGTVAAWGYNDCGQLGNNSVSTSNVPVTVVHSGVLSGKPVVAISAGRFHSLALCSDGTMYTWGQNLFGQLGNGNTTESHVPVAVTASGALSGKSVISISAGHGHNLALCSDGTVVGWGDNGSGQVGNNSSSNVLEPVALNSFGFLSGKTVLSVSAGQFHSTALCSNGSPATWGWNACYQLGNNSTNDSHVPVAVLPPGALTGKPVVALGVGAAHNLALCADGTLVSWGDGTYGELGNGTTTSSQLPVVVSTNNLEAGERFMRVSAGSNRTNNFVVVGQDPPAAPTTAVRLTNNGFDEISPKWHPTNGKIAFLRKNGSGNYNPCSINADGTADTTLVTGLVQPPYGYTTLISWLGNTNWLLCVETNNFHELMAFDTLQAPFTRTVADGNDAAFTRKLFVPGGRYSNAFVASRNGSTVAWRDQPNSGGANSLTIRTAFYFSLFNPAPDTNTTGTTVLTASDSSIGTRGMALSADGSKLAISMPSGSGFDIWLYSTSGGPPPVQLTTDGASGVFNLNPDISPDGTKVIYQASTSTPGSTELWLMSINGTGKTNLTQTPGVDESHPSWGPNGFDYAFVRVDGSESNIYRDTLSAGGSVVTINFDNLPTGAQASNFLAAYGIPSVTYFGAAHAGPPLVDAQLGGNTTIPSPPNLLIQHGGGGPESNDVGESHTMRFDFGPQLTAFALTRAGKFGYGSTDTWHADFYNSAGSYLGSFGESSPLINAAPKAFTFTAPSGQTIARMELVSVYTNFATNRNIPVDDFVLTQAGALASTQLTGLSLSVGTLSPAFVTGTTSYTASVSNATSSVTITPTITGPGSVTVNNVPVASGNASGPITLAVNNNTITVRVLTGSTVVGTYLVGVNRAPSTNANLNNLALSTGTLNPAFASATTSYTASVPNGTTSITVTPTVQDSTATVKVNNVTVTSGSPSGSIALNVGNNTITTVVKAQNNTTTKTYTTVVTRAPSTNANLASLALTAGSLSPGFASGTFSYNASVAYSASSVRVTATVADNTATLKVNNVTTSSGAAGAPINLAVGNNTITVKVTAQDGTTPLIYTIGITRAAPSIIADLSNLAISAGTLSPAFSAATPAYTASVTHLTPSLTVTSTVAESHATIKVNNVTVASGQASAAVALPVGTSTITIRVIAEDGVTTRTYTVDITRAAFIATWNSATDIPMTTASYTPAGDITFVLNFAPVTGTTLTVINYTGLPFLNGRFGNLAQGQAVALTFNNITYDFIANYYGGTGNDLVLQWANVRPVAWGAGSSGKLGTGGAFGSPTAGAVNQSGQLLEKVVIAEAAGGDHSLALCSDGTLASWGENSFGQLGNNSSTASTVPVAVTMSGTLNGKTVVAIAAGSYHSLALCSDGSVYAWGDNSFGQLGDNSTTRRTTPTAVYVAGVLAGKSVVAIAAGQYHSFALCSDGSIVSWGGNFMGQLGDNTTTQRKVPVSLLNVGALNGKSVIAIAAGQYHSLALCTDGNIAAWGTNNGGQLGDGTTNQRNAPVLVDRTGLLSTKSVSRISAGGFGHCLALCTDGSIAAWGYNWAGQLGDGTTTQRPSPVAVISNGVLVGRTVTNIYAGSSHSLAICSDGTLTSWGDNSSVQLGTGNYSSSPVPVLVSTIDLAAGERFTSVSTIGCAVHNLAMVAAAAPTGPVPQVTTLAASSVTSTSATLNGTVNANNASTTASFNLGTLATYGTNVAAVPSTVTGSTTTAVTAGLIGLTPGTTYHFRVKGVNVNGTRNGGDLTFATPSNNANLADLSTSAGTLSPAFASSTVNYTTTVTHAVASLTVTPTVAESHTSVTVGGNPVTSGNASPSFPLIEGSNPIDVVATAQDGTPLTYHLVVTRLPLSTNSNLASLALSKGTLTPAFASGVHFYDANVSGVVSNITVTPVVADPGAAVTVDNDPVLSGSQSEPIVLVNGSNTITVRVLAEDGTSETTYEITVHRGIPSTNADLANLTTSSGTLAPTFSSAETDYTSHVSYATTSITVTPTIADGSATVKVNNATVLPGNASGPISLAIGENTIDIVVTAEDGIANRVYTLVVTRDPQEYVWAGNTGTWSDASKWTLAEAPPIGGNAPVGSTSVPMILKFFNNPTPVNPTTPTTYNATNDRGNNSGFTFNMFGIAQLHLNGGSTGATGTGTSIIGSPTPGFGDPNLFFVDGASIVNETSNGISYTIQNYITANLNLTLTGNGTETVKFGSVLQTNMFVQPFNFGDVLHILKTGTSTFELPTTQSNNISYDIREGTLQSSPGTMSSGPINIGYSSSMSATLRIGTIAGNAGGLSDTADITIVAGPVGSTRTIKSLATAANESVFIAGDLTIPTGSSVRLDTGSDEFATMSLGGNGSIISGGGDIIVCGLGKLFINSQLNNSNFTGRIIVESGSYQPAPALPGGGFTPPPTTLGGGEMTFTASNGNYSQSIVVDPPIAGADPSAFTVTDNGTLAGLLTMNGGVDMSVALNKNFVFEGGLSGAIPDGQSLNVNAMGTSAVSFFGDTTGFTGVIDFGRDVGAAGSSASMIFADVPVIPDTVDLNVFAGKLVFAPTVSTTSDASIDFKATGPGAALPQLVLQNDTPASPANVTLGGPMTYERETVIAIPQTADRIDVSGNITNLFPDAGIDKQGDGTLVLAPLAGALPTDVYTAPIDVEDGTLKVNRDLSDSDVSVANGATLGGAGFVGDLSVDPGAIIAPGNSPGMLTAATAILTGATLAVEINGASADQLRVMGPLNLGGCNLTVSLLAGGFTQASYVIAQGNPLTGTFGSVPNGYVVNYSSTQATLTLPGGSSPFGSWITTYNSPPLSAGDKLPGADPDKDNICNLLEFVLGSSPIAASPTALPTQTTDGSNIAFHFKRSDASQTDTTLSVEISNGLGDWTSVPAIPVGASSGGAVTVTENGAADDDVTVLIPLGNAGHRFVRLKAISTGP